jgi:3-ketosteroid 9alpha-monooxygenase subunit A
MYKHGWFKVAFEKELENPITPAAIGDTRLILVRTADGIRTYSADCPHRGAHLGYGGKLDGNSIICPFHGYRSRLGLDPRHEFSIREYETIAAGGAVFVRLSDSHDYGFSSFIRQLAEENFIVSAFVMPVKAPAYLVTENGFDSAHFPAVHKIVSSTKFEVTTGESGQLIVSSSFIVPMGYKQTAKTDFIARTFSPGLIVTRLSGDMPYGIMTGTLPISANESVIRLSLILPREHHGPTPNEQFCRNLTEYSWNGLVDDRLMWENMSLTAPNRLTAQDNPILTFHQFCDQFVN